MDSSGEQLHPNWRALATLHLPLKRFVSAKGDEQQPSSTGDEKKYEIVGISGEKIQEFYKEIIETPAIVGSKQIKSSQRLPQKVDREKFLKLEPLSAFNQSKLFLYATHNDVRQMKLMSISREQVDVRDAYGWTALMMAACENSTDAVKYLLQLGADVELTEKTGYTATSLALRKGHLRIIELLEEFTSNSRQSSAKEVKKLPSISPFHCDVCIRDFNNCTRKSHETSTVHQFNTKPTVGNNKLNKFNIPTQNRGLQLMIKQGWDREHGLGPTNSGRLYPIKTVLRKNRSGIGIEQPPARVTHELPAMARQQRSYDRSRNDMRREKVREWKRERRLRYELS